MTIQAEPSATYPLFPSSPRGSPISATLSYPTNLTDKGARSVGTIDTLNDISVQTPKAIGLDHLLPPGPYTTISRTYTSLQEHSDRISVPKLLADEAEITPRHEGRREGFVVAQRPSMDARQSNKQYPFHREQLQDKTHPSLEHVLRRQTFDEGIQNPYPQFHRTSSIGSPPSTAPQSSSEELSHASTRRSSVAMFAKGLARQIPDTRLFDSPGKAAESEDGVRMRASQGASWTKISRKDRRFSSAPSAPRTIERKNERALNAQADDTFTCAQTGLETPSAKPAGRSLRERRKVNLDLSATFKMPELPERGRSPLAAASSLVPSRRRSPKTPWIRHAELTWDPEPLAKSTPIIESACVQKVIVKEEHHDRYSIGYPTHSHCDNDPSICLGTESTAVHPLYEKQLPKERMANSEHKKCVIDEAGGAHQSSKRTRYSRWRWRQVSDSTQQLQSSSSRQFSLNPFKHHKYVTSRSEQPDSRKHELIVSQTHTKGSSLERSKPHLSPASMSVPPAFIPPEATRINTPPLVESDTREEVKTKLADFYFKVHGSAEETPRRKRRTSPSGHWDSDALLMSLTTKLAHEGDTEDEGPEGRIEDKSNSLIDFDVNGSPGLVAVPFRYGVVHPESAGGLTAMETQDNTWFRIPHNELHNDQERTPTALEEEEDRLKFEWLIPEHLPGSPLCPLHDDYSGPWKNMCY